MCGIIGILGRSDVSERILEGLSLLEYRGYDSAGLALIEPDGRVGLRRSVGKLSELRAAVDIAPITGHAGIGHTRWATHGAAIEANAHPHQTRNVTLVHNGIIENYAEIKSELERDGVRFSSETDTEVAAHYFEKCLKTSSTLDAAWDKLLERIVGSYAFAAVFSGYPDLIFAARQGSPLAIGYGAPEEDGTSEMFLGSDALALAPFTDRVSYLEDGDRAIIRPDRVQIFDATGAEVTREIVTVTVANWSVDKGPYRHYMLKEIHDQPQSLARLLTHLFDTHAGTLKPFLPDLDFGQIERVTLVACGTAYYACQVAKTWIREIAGLPVEIEIASEYRYAKRIASDGELFVAVSQSGETADTLAAIKDVRGEAEYRLAVVNVSTSSIAREADHIIDIMAGPEIGVASTKAFTGQLLALLAIALKAGNERGILSDEALASVVHTLASIPRIVTETIALEDTIVSVAKDVAQHRDAIFLGRGIHYPMALEAALKLKEISYIHADGYAAGELKHGPIALVDPDMAVIVFDSVGFLQEKTSSNAAEVKARGARVWHVGRHAEEGIRTPDSAEIVTPFSYAVVAQMLAYHAALARGTDIDQPRNLAKSVTVE